MTCWSQGLSRTQRVVARIVPCPFGSFLAGQNSGPLTFDIDITVEPVTSDNPMAPTHRVLDRSPRGRLVECGGIWKKQNRDTGADYFTLTIRDFGFNANLGKAANQDDEKVQAVIPWGPKEAV